MVTTRVLLTFLFVLMRFSYGKLTFCGVFKKDLCLLLFYIILFIFCSHIIVGKQNANTINKVNFKNLLLLGYMWCVCVCVYIMINCRLCRVERGRGVYKISFVGYQSYIIININN